MALVNKTFSQLATLVRSTSGSYFDSSGVMQTTAINTPRFDYDPATLEPLGLLVEPASSNILTYSEQLDNAAWTKGGTTIVADTTVAPDGNVTADKVMENTTTGTHSVFRSITLSNSTTYTFSVFLKAAGRGFARILLSGNVLTASTVNIDLTNGSVTSNDITKVTVKNCGNGWWRLSGTVTTIASVTGATNILVYPTISLGVPSYTGDGVSGIYVWGTQLEPFMSTPTSYMATTTTSATRGSDTLAILTSTGWRGANNSYNISAGAGVNSALGTNSIQASGNGYIRSISYFPNP